MAVSPAITAIGTGGIMAVGTTAGNIMVVGTIAGTTVKAIIVGAMAKGITVEDLVRIVATMVDRTEKAGITVSTTANIMGNTMAQAEIARIADHRRLKRRPTVLMKPNPNLQKIGRRTLAATAPIFETQAWLY